MNGTLTIENFGPNNRDKRVGKSLYRICRQYDDSGKWYISESYNDQNEWSRYRAYFSEDLRYVVDKINSFNKEKEIINMMPGKEDTPCG